MQKEKLDEAAIRLRLIVEDLMKAHALLDDKDGGLLPRNHVMEKKVNAALDCFDYLALRVIEAGHRVAEPVHPPRAKRNL
jgi:hypothetical protein